jgi:hypothetical protein
MSRWINLYHFGLENFKSPYTIQPVPGFCNRRNSITIKHTQYSAISTTYCYNSTAMNKRGHLFRHIQLIWLNHSNVYVYVYIYIYTHTHTQRENKCQKRYPLPQKKLVYDSIQICLLWQVIMKLNTHTLQRDLGDFQLHYSFNTRVLVKQTPHT